MNFLFFLHVIRKVFSAVYSLQENEEILSAILRINHLVLAISHIKTFSSRRGYQNKHSSFVSMADIHCCLSSGKPSYQKRANLKKFFRKFLQSLFFFLITLFTKIFHFHSFFSTLFTYDLFIIFTLYVYFFSIVLKLMIDE